jgi:nickel/cobalt transporter (NicO) family protein
VAAALVVLATPASAHPLGNFTVNRYARVELSAGVVRVYYVLDEAEIPAFEERAAVDADPAAFARRRAGAIAGGLTLDVDNTRLPLDVEASNLSQPQGQGGLHTLRLAIRFRAALPAGRPDEPRAVGFADANEPDRVGWREIVVAAQGDARVLRSDAPSRDATNELRSYPADLIKSPLDLRRATFTFTPGTVTVSPVPLSDARRAAPRAGGSFANLITRQALTPWVVATMLGLAFVVGSVHALAPGHGKTVMAAYLVGTRGRASDAVLLGSIVSLMHTGSVLGLGLVLFHVSRSVQLDRLYPILTFVGGVVVVAMGAWLLRARWRTLRATRTGAAHDHHHGSGEHEHEHGHSHSHELPAGVSPLSRRGLVVLAGAGGILPSPSAVIVVVSAFALGRIALGLALVGAFSLGLAATLTAVGLALVVGRDFVERRGARWLQRLPTLGASALMVVGSVVAAQGLRGL